MDTGSGCSIIDLGTLQRIGLDNCIDKSSRKALINASGDTMKILGTVKIDERLLVANLVIMFFKYLIQ